MTLGVARQQTPSSRQRTVMADGSECVAKFAIFRGGVANAIGGKQRKIQRAGNFDGGAVASFFFAMKMALQFDIHIAAAK